MPDTLHICAMAEHVFTPWPDFDKCVIVIKDVLSVAECRELIQLSEKQGYVPAVIHKADGRVVFDQQHRDSDRVMIDDPARANDLFARLQAHLPSLYNGRALAGINERWRYLKYREGQRFCPHFDGCYERPDGSETSCLTLQIYLSGDLEGGETVVYHDNDKQLCTVVCEAGQVLIFDHDLYHEGAPVKRGCKYCVRTDVMYHN